MFECGRLAARILRFNLFWWVAVVHKNSVAFYVDAKNVEEKGKVMMVGFE